MKYIYEEYINVRINTYICRMLYRKLGKDKSNRFIKGKNRKISYESFENILSRNGENITPSKVSRIIKCEGKSHFTANEIKSISQTFNIDERYFKIGNDVTILVPGLTVDDWKIYLNVKYQTSDRYKIPISNSVNWVKREKEIEDIIENAVDDILKNSKWKSLSSDDPLYRILHLYTSGSTFVGADEETIVRKKLNSVEELKYDDFIKINIEELYSHIASLEKKLDLMKAIALVETHKQKK